MIDGGAAPPGDPDLAAMAQDELARALTLKWRDLADVTPWGDSYEGISPAGRNVMVDRSYIWRSETGGDILVEVAVYGGPSRYDAGEHATAVIARGEQNG
ncbi:MAG TPA: hypothetical protein VGF42_02470 [Caulobacteraceae bacterium]|jgi:hypothetical protein